MARSNQVPQFKRPMDPDAYGEAIALAFAAVHPELFPSAEQTAAKAEAERAAERTATA